MSEAQVTPVSALNHVRFDGIATVQECGLQGMITLRGDLSSRGLKAGATEAGAARMPKPGQANVRDAGGLCWMSPDELLILCPYDAVAARLATLDARLSATHYLAVNVSDARAMFRVSGAGAREVIAKLAPADLAPQAFEPGMFRRTRLAQVAAAFWIGENGDIHVICFRSVADYVFGVLRRAAMPGSEVGIF